MKVSNVKFRQLVVSDELRRSGSAKQFEDRLAASIAEVGLAEPLKVARVAPKQYLIVDGVMRYRAIAKLREKEPGLFTSVPVYVTDLDRRFEIRYQTDIYQDLLPSQLAGLVEHLHKTEQISKGDIARYIGVSPATLRNYTGLWRLLQRGGLFAQVVQLMDAGVLPASNPYAWLRLTAEGLRQVIETQFSEHDELSEEWINRCVQDARKGSTIKRYATKFVESVTDGLAPEMYREAPALREVKRDLGLRRASPQTLFHPKLAPKRNGVAATRRHLNHVTKKSTEPVLQSAARSLLDYLK